MGSMSTFMVNPLAGQVPFERQRLFDVETA
jgi:hypothetical protein